MIGEPAMNQPPLGFAALLLLPLALLGCAHPLPRTASYDVARSASVPHKAKAVECTPYAEAVAPLLAKSGATNIHRLTYRWLKGNGKAASRGTHSVVAYTDALGQDWICDNEWPWPRHTLGTDMEERCRWFVRRHGEGAGLTLISDVPYN